METRLSGREEFTTNLHKRTRTEEGEFTTELHGGSHGGKKKQRCSYCPVMRSDVPCNYL
jgi:hypothetical protein